MLSTSNMIPAERAFRAVNAHGVTSAPRSLRIREVIGYQDRIEYPFHSFRFRHDNLNYIKKEFLWYLKGDPYDQSICDHASIWPTIVQPDGRIFSNYGYYWFRRLNKDGVNGLGQVVWTLRNDPDSRQAYIPMLGKEHMFSGNKDVVCTKGILFRIVQDKLIMIVNMRSSDLAIGASIDWPCFSWLHEMVAFELQVEKGDFYFNADSLHVYEKNFAYMRDVINCTKEDIAIIEPPRITSVSDLLLGTNKSEFGQWLMDNQD